MEGDVVAVCKKHVIQLHTARERGATQLLCEIAVLVRKPIGATEPDDE